MQNISIVIVNYNVKHFLRECLLSVARASDELDTEIFVVDNQSVDGSVAMLREEFPSVKVTANKENVGFATANNQAIFKAKGKYTLILNPDTVIEEDTLKKCFSFCESKENVGLVGVKMVDGSGAFLPESKRGFPSPSRSFWRLTGISKLFPKSKMFNAYNLGHISEDETSEVDVLCGAFIFGETKLLQDIGGFDESFFMYGEDIDLSYRVQKEGRVNYYLPTTTIIHYKGQSTRKTELKYVGVFYKAMLIFAKKHFTKGKGGWLIALLTVAIYLRGFGSVIKRVFQALAKPLLDFILIVGVLWAIKLAWGEWYFGDHTYFDDSPVKTNILSYGLIWSAMIFLSGGYRDFFHLGKLFRAILIGFLLILGLYALLPLDWRTSRAIILLGGIAIPIILFASRFFIHWIEHKRSILSSKKGKRIAIVGKEEEISRIRGILSEKSKNENYTIALSTERLVDAAYYDGSIKDLDEIISIENIDELIFCLKDISISEVLKQMSSISQNVSYKVVGDESLSIIGSKSSNVHGEMYSMDIDFDILKPERKIQKRVIDLVFSMAYLLFFVLLIIRNLFGKQWSIGERLRDIVLVIMNKKTMISYITNDARLEELPTLKNGVFSVSNINEEEVHFVNKNYALKYTVTKDIFHFFRILIQNK